MPGNDANDSDVYDSSEEEGLEEAEADFLVSNVLKRSGMCDECEASGVQLCSLALGGALVSLVFVMFIYYLHREPHLLCDCASGKFSEEGQHDVAGHRAGYIYQSQTHCGTCYCQFGGLGRANC